MPDTNDGDPQELVRKLREQLATMAEMLVVIEGRMAPLPVPKKPARERARERWGLAAFAGVLVWAWGRRTTVGLALASAAASASAWALVQPGPLHEGGPQPTFTRTARTVNPTVTRTEPAVSPAPTARSSGRAPALTEPTGRGERVAPRPAATRPPSHPPNVLSTLPTLPSTVAPTVTVPTHAPKLCVKVKVGKLAHLRLLCRQVEP